jgi:hypothetical protein
MRGRQQNFEVLKTSEFYALGLLTRRLATDIRGRANLRFE